MSIYEKILNKENKISLIGLGYVGLPIALEFAKKCSVIGFDINEERVEMMRNGIDPSNELEAAAFDNTDIHFTSNPEDLKEAQFHIIAVPTPVDAHKVPNLKPVLSASRAVGKILKKGDYVVYESTVYPGCTEEDCLPILEAESGLKVGEDFKIGYSPERINPGDKHHTITKIIKVVSGSDEEALENISKVYRLIIEAGVFHAKTIKVAEAAKVIENTQRDLNIALMNELSVIFDKMDINTRDVLDAAGTKWNFLKFSPGLVGGHCIGVDPYYLTYKANKLGFRPQVILSGRSINDSMSHQIVKKIIKFLINAKKNIVESKILVMGVTFKENVSDIRNSKISDLVKELQEYQMQVDVTDPYADSDELQHEYGFKLTEKDKIRDDYDCIILAVNHRDYKDLNEKYFQEISSENGILIDVKGMFNHQIKEMTYWTL